MTESITPPPPAGPPLQFKLADMATGLEASRVMVRQAAAALDAQSPRATLTAAMAKRFATDTCFGVANDALQLLGGYGYLQVCMCWCFVCGVRGGGVGGFATYRWSCVLVLVLGVGGVCACS
jgi:hypothetical protein